MNPAEAACTWPIAIEGDETRALLERAPEASANTLFVFAHGAGGHRDDRGMTALAEQVRAAGVHVVRFNFLYREKGSRRPDPMPRLTACIAAVAERARRELGPGRLLLGGRSMGGRASSVLAAQGFPCDGLLLLAYPLHPAKRPDRLRDAHLPQIRVPVLCLSGTRDALCRRDLMEQTQGRLGDLWTQHWLADADHSFHVRRSSGRSDPEVLEEIGGALRDWLPGVPCAR